MTSKNATIQQLDNPNNHLERDCRNCRTIMVGDTGLVKCLMETTQCQWAILFGNGRFCKHPSAKQLIKSYQP